MIDFLAVLLGYARSFERSLEEFYERLLPFAQPFMALFDREKLPSRSALSRFLASMSLEATETLRTPVFPQSDTAVPLLIEQETPAWSLALMGRGLPLGNGRGVRQRNCLHHSVACIRSVPPFYTGRKRGEVVRTRTVI